MRNRLLVVLAATGLFATQAIAQEYSNIYIGAGLISTDIKTSIDLGGIADTAYDGDTTGGVGLVGYSFSEFLAVEGLFASTGRANGEAVLGASGTNQLLVNGETDMRSFEVVAKGTIPLGMFEVFARGGVIWGDVDYDIDASAVEAGTGVVSPNKFIASTQDAGIVLGLGGGYRFGRGAIRLQYDYIGLEFKETNNYLVTFPDGGNFVQNSVPITFETKNPKRIMLTVSGYF